MHLTTEDTEDTEISPVLTSVPLWLKIYFYETHTKDLATKEQQFKRTVQDLSHGSRVT